MKEIAISIFLFFFCFTIKALSQKNANDNKKVCLCSTSFPFYDRNEYENFLPSKIISKEGIKEVIIYSTTTIMKKQLRHDMDVSSKKQSNNTITVRRPPECLVLKLQFDSLGRVVSRYGYYSEEPAYKYVYERDTIGNIVTETLTRFGSLSSGALRMIDFEYDNSNRLIKEQDRNSWGKVLAEDSANYIKYEYDNKDRIISMSTFHNFYGSTTPYVVTYKYNGTSTAVANKTLGEELISSVSIIYDEERKLLKKEYTHGSMKGSISTYTYDSRRRLISIKRKKSIGGTETIAKFSYTDSGLLIRDVQNRYDTICSTRFDYKK